MHDDDDDIVLRII